MTAQPQRCDPLCRLLAGLALGVFGTFSSATPAGAAAVADKEIRIGMVNAQTGPAAHLGQGLLAGAQAVFEDVNAGGGVHGRKITLKVADDGFEPEQTQEQTLEMIEHEKVLALFGYVGTATVNSVLPMLRELDVPLIGVFSGSKSLRMPVTPQLFNLRASFDQEADVLVNRLIASGAQKIGVVYQNDGLGLAVLAGVDAALKSHKMAVHAAGSYQRNTVAVRTALGVMMESEPDAIVLAGPYVPVATFIQQARKLGSKAVFATVSFVGTESLVSKLGRDAEGVYISQVVPSPRSTSIPVVQECNDALVRYSSEELSYINLEGCISAKLLVRALQIAGPDLTRQTLMAALEDISAQDLGGFRVELSASNHQASDRVFLTRVQHGQASWVP